MKPLAMLAAGAALIGLAACEVRTKESEPAANEVNQVETVEAQPMDQPNPDAVRRANELALMFGSDQLRAEARQNAARELENLRAVVDISDRKIRLFKGDQMMEEHDVAVGTKEWPTPTGEWQFHRVDINPEWVPPKSEEWAEDAETKGPGDPENPMGRARLVYRMPNTVHGTDDLNSLGKASSHGSIRVANEVVLRLAEMLLKAGNSWNGQQWFKKMTENRDKEYMVELEKKIPIKVQE